MNWTTWNTGTPEGHLRIASLFIEHRARTRTRALVAMGKTGSSVPVFQLFQPWRGGEQ